jgi:hypothetical protein
VWLFVLVAVSLSGTVVRTNVQSPAPGDTLAPVARLVRRWTGTSEGQPGKGQVEGQYERVLGSKFIQVRNRSTYPPQEKSPKGETHCSIEIAGEPPRRAVLPLALHEHLDNVAG